ncbi:glycoside hydrolase family 97 protein [Snuella sedimenti]|uniref:Glycoside hydrolase family 97 catalytic domain-containing protein n=1 Tax=Snuella sedimenti TaxID=2798802 RepID=A0A8J7LP46_9FLAO|nr:glycoside hydrolase family 97 protein [Snuella sedimenti]MBJ6368803.1 glycoside hydrolase family 97 catalytic domain-containing protein [Snuella sedimenti]
MNRKKRWFIIPLNLLIAGLCYTQEALTSPDNQLTFHIALLEKPEAGANIASYADGSHLYYSLSSNGRDIIDHSPLGLTLNYTDFFNDLQFKSNSQVELNKDSYNVIHGKHTKINSIYNERDYEFINSDNQLLIIKVRAYNEGIAFRYILPDNYTKKRRLLVEHTGFRIPTEGKAWMAPYSGPTKWKPAYELYYTNGSKVAQPAPEKPGWVFPALFQVNNEKDWVLIHEAGLERNYPGTHLGNDCLDGIYRIAFPDPGEALGMYRAIPSFTGPWEMPWRVIVTSKTLSKIIENNMVLDLNKPVRPLQDISWIKPGRVSWEWWSTQVRERDFNLNKTFIDLASDMGWEYCLIDANWNEMKDGTINQLIQYATNKGVGIFLWYNSGGPHNYVSEQPRGRLHDPRVRKEEFTRIKSWGVKGIKIDFFNSDKQVIIEQYLDILEDALDHELLVNFHGCTVPRGWSRTYPNLLSMEAVKGEETYGFGAEFPEKAPSYNTIIPFTRNTVGSMDYTPVGFTKHTFPHLTTNAHELALTIVFQSALLHFADSPEAYSKQPKEIIQFLKDIPAQFDEVKLIDGYPGAYVAIARRKGNKWYIGVISGQSKPIELQLDLSFIKTNNTKLMEISDAKDGQFSFKQNNIKQQLHTCTLQPYGGSVIIINEQ